MVNYQIIAVATLLAGINGLPLNINLGAYSPALVVGDGEISFGGGQDVTTLLNALEGAAVTSASANGATNGAAKDIQALKVPSDPKPTDVAIEKQGSEPAQATPAAAGTGLQQQAEQTSGLQGLGKEISPREEPDHPSIKRDLAGFDRALTYAEAALTKGPLIQLGTGEGGAGVGIIVDNRPNAGAGAGTGESAGEGAAKRDEASQPRQRMKVTRMYVKRGIPTAFKNTPEFEARSIGSTPVSKLPTLSRRDSSSDIDAINLNIPGEEEITMTFVEMADEDDTAQQATASN
ncbi:hypothetical protein F4777DRAFT_578989 [Nemania sp. FL0916]|nr:hypothetical protein F4777DRAFT_578989 [Nemania sp. FL0916]